MDEEILLIAKKFKSLLKSNLVSVMLHGSYAQDFNHKNSDIDYFLILKKIDLPTLFEIRKLKEDAEQEYGREISINIQKVSEMPKIRKETFYHKNRCALFLHEANKIDKVLIGENPYYLKDLPSEQELKIESIKIINSFAYFLRKYLVNSDLDFSFKESLRYVVMSTQYANAFVGDYPKSTKDSVESFSKNFSDFSLKELPMELIEIKRGTTKVYDKEKILGQSIAFLEELDEYLFGKYSSL